MIGRRKRPGRSPSLVLGGTGVVSVVVWQMGVGKRVSNCFSTAQTVSLIDIQGRDGREGRKVRTINVEEGGRYLVDTCSVCEAT